MEDTLSFLTPTNHEVYSVKGWTNERKILQGKAIQLRLQTSSIPSQELSADASIDSAQVAVHHISKPVQRKLFKLHPTCPPSSYHTTVHFDQRITDVVLTNATKAQSFLAVLHVCSSSPSNRLATNWPIFTATIASNGKTQVYNSHARIE
ncbi:hypothetical protein PMIN06_002334 [Paraphaeosphaeria minitans]